MQGWLSFFKTVVFPVVLVVGCLFFFDQYQDRIKSRNAIREADAHQAKIESDPALYRKAYVQAVIQRPFFEEDGTVCFSVTVSNQGRKPIRSAVFSVTPQSGTMKGKTQTIRLGPVPPGQKLDLRQPIEKLNAYVPTFYSYLGELTGVEF
ncbi:MAG: hypothetical protein A2498_00325 [Lentisphaerae bacterium RIFOXYC12_FULL_60_16]|nr:MAG: hypothetical protein A2498_00325 [Lentisphaerae bacterium RIFOXYC12_FULL_60_16]